jgi:hypothetical protein
MSNYGIVGRFLFVILAWALSASNGSKGCPFGLVGCLVISLYREMNDQL